MGQIHKAYDNVEKGKLQFLWIGILCWAEFLS